MPSTPSVDGKISMLCLNPAENAYFDDLVTLSKYVHQVTVSRYERAPLSPRPPPARKFRSRPTARDGAPKLVFCHDFMNGYVDDARKPWWTMSWWGMTDVFIYFSHHRVSPPPREWVNAGHRQGCKVLGTLILEGATNPDQYRLFDGDSGSDVEPTRGFATRYADDLVDLCDFRGFDGWLLNIEVDGYKNANEARRLRDWVNYLTLRSRARLGERSCIIWYDSITTAGPRDYQNTLNTNNAPFFYRSDMLFTNYWYNRDLIPSARNYLQERPASDVAFGIDVWGLQTDPPRSTWRDGGYKSCLALDDIRTSVGSDGSNFSTALFAPGYLWEDASFKDHDRTSWWPRETLYWLGRSTLAQQQKDLQMLNTDLNKIYKPHVDGPCEVFHPIKDYFSFKPQTIPFATTFSLGAGTYFNVEGRSVAERFPGITEDFPWTDHELVGPLPDLVLPCTIASSDSFTYAAVLVTCDVIDDRKNVWFAAHAVQLSCPSYIAEHGKLFVPLCTVDVKKTSVVAVEIVWTSADTKKTRITCCEAGHHEPGPHARGVISCSPTSTTSAGIGDWFKTTSLISNVTGIARIGATIQFFSRAQPLIIGAISIRDASITLYCDTGEMMFTFAKQKTDLWGILEWKDGNNPRKPHSASLDDENIIYEVTAHLMLSTVGTSNPLFWGTTSMTMMRLSWENTVAQAEIQSVEAHGGYVELRVQAIDASGYRHTESSMRVRLGERRVLYG